MIHCCCASSCCCSPSPANRTPDKASNTNQQLPADTHQPLQLLLQREPASATDHCGCCAAAAAVLQTATTATTLPAGAVGGDGGDILCRTVVQQGNRRAHQQGQGSATSMLAQAPSCN
jgi:hypothetical protein